MIDELCVGRAIAINCVNSKLSQESKTEESMLFIEKGYFFLQNFDCRFSADTLEVVTQEMGQRVMFKMWSLTNLE